MNYSIPYGKNNIDFQIPDKNLISFNQEYLANTEFENENEIIRKALENPIACSRLKELSKGKRSICILVSDITRPSPSYKFLPNILSELDDQCDVKIVFGLGIHRKHTQEEKIKLAGKVAAQRCSLIDFDKDKCIEIGRTSFGTPIEIFEEVVNSDFIIATGNIEYHYFAGYSGGSKAVMPGVCSYNSVCANHSMMLDNMARAGEFFNNPVRRDIEEAGQKAGINFIFNVILDDYKNIIGAVSGKNNEAFIEGIKMYDSFYEISSYEKADIVITSSGGYPKDINLYQAQKALDNVKDLVKDNGTVILAAECIEGFGEDKFEEWMQDTRDFENLHCRIKEKFVLGGHKAVAVSKMLTKIKVMLLSAFDNVSTGNMGFDKIENIQSFIDQELSINKNLRIAVVANGRFIKYLNIKK